MSHSKIQLDEYNFIVAQPTPWDERVFERKTVEIREWEFQTKKKGKELLKLLEDKTNPEFCYGRFDASDMMKKEILINDGYGIYETAIDLVLSGLNNYSLPKIYGSRLLSISHATKEDRSDLVKYSGNMFNYSRFHEDPFIGLALADKRMKKWVKQMLNQDFSALKYRDPNGNLVSFLFYNEDNKNIDLVLGGSVEKKGFVSPFFFGSVINFFKNKENIKKIITRVSAANVGILKIYIDLGFKIEETFFDYHKHF